MSQILFWMCGRPEESLVKLLEPFLHYSIKLTPLENELEWKDGHKVRKWDVIKVVENVF